MTQHPNNTTPDANRLAATRERVSAINQELAAIRADARAELLAVLNRRDAIDRELNYLADIAAGATADTILDGLDLDIDAGLIYWQRQLARLESEHQSIQAAWNAYADPVNQDAMYRRSELERERVVAQINEEALHFAVAQTEAESAGDI